MPRNTKQSNEQALTPFAQRLSELMEERGVSQAQVGEAIGAQRQTVSLYKLGQSKPDIESLAKIARFFEVTSDYLIGLSEDNIPDLEARAIVDKTGLSKQALDVLLELKEDALLYSFNLWEAISFILTHSEFMAFLDDVACARTYSYLITHKDVLDAKTSDEEHEKFFFGDDAIDFDPFGVALVDFKEKVELEEFHATRHMSKIISDLCANGHASETVRQRVHGMTETGGELNGET